MTASSGKKASILTLGPLLFHWPVGRWSDFYARIADEAPVDRVCIGEVVCSKRLPFYADRAPAAIERLQRGGKEVVFSSLALVTLKRERRLCRELAESGTVEINDVSVLAHLEPGRRFVVGPLINVYNEATLGFLAERGAVSICLPPELPEESVVEITRNAKGLDVDTEVLAFGRVPLAISARCYHARIHGLSKDSCQFVCGNDPDGLDVDTLDNEPIMALNGVQTLTSSYRHLLDRLVFLQRKGVRSFRLSPHTCDMVAVSQLFRSVLDDQMNAATAIRELTSLMPGAEFTGWFGDGAHPRSAVLREVGQIRRPGRSSV
jgi:O2-independent ubiquinone biosynthesis protein UbiV